MYTIDRFNAIRNKYGLAALKPEALTGEAHERINALDSAAGIDTSNGIRTAPLGRSGVTSIRTVGARLRQHENFIDRKSQLPPHEYHHWLGSSCSCSCGCHNGG